MGEHHLWNTFSSKFLEIVFTFLVEIKFTAVQKTFFSWKSSSLPFHAPLWLKSSGFFSSSEGKKECVADILFVK